MINPNQLATALIVGAALGGGYFSGLWWTVCRLPRARHPLALYFGSLLLRLAAVLAGFYVLLAMYDWPQLPMALLGFVSVRMAILGLLGRRAPAVSRTGEAG